MYVEKEWEGRDEHDSEECPLHTYLDDAEGLFEARSEALRYC